VLVLLLELVGGDWSISVVQNLETKCVVVVLDLQGISVIVLVIWFSCCFTAVLLLPLLSMNFISLFHALLCTLRNSCEDVHGAVVVIRVRAQVTTFRVLLHSFDGSK
jgi:hypothetical protein